jgi:hypothetical protein
MIELTNAFRLIQSCDKMGRSVSEVGRFKWKCVAIEGKEGVPSSGESNADTLRSRTKMLLGPGNRRGHVVT